MDIYVAIGYGMATIEGFQQKDFNNTSSQDLGATASGRWLRDNSFGAVPSPGRAMFSKDVQQA